MAISSEINADSGEISTWHSRDHLIIAYERAKPIIDNYPTTALGRPWLKAN